MPRPGATSLHWFPETPHVPKAFRKTTRGRWMLVSARFWQSCHSEKLRTSPIHVDLATPITSSLCSKWLLLTLIWPLVPSPGFHSCSAPNKKSHFSWIEAYQAPPAFLDRVPFIRSISGGLSLPGPPINAGFFDLGTADILSFFVVRGEGAVLCIVGC